MKALFRFSALGLLTLVGLLSSGCVAVVAGGAAAGGAIYALGDLKTDLQAPVGTVRRAIGEAGTALELKPISEDTDQLTGHYTYRTGDDTRITIRYKTLTAETTELSIRVGTFGDEKLSQRILERIQRAL